MRAVVYRRIRELPQIAELPEPPCPSDGVVVAVRATGLCRSDWHAWMGHEPVPLPRPIRRGGTYHVVTECRGDHTVVSIDGTRVYEQCDEAFRGGGVGFRVGEPLDQGLFAHVTLQKL